jgi:hypothetical protein
MRKKTSTAHITNDNKVCLNLIDGRRVTVNLTPDEYRTAYKLWQAGVPITEAFSVVSSTVRSCIRYFHFTKN